MSWGNGETLIQLVEQIGHKEGLGARLGEGSVRFAAKLGPEAAEFVIAVKGLEIAMHDPRGFVSMAANYATANRGAATWKPSASGTATVCLSPTWAILSPWTVSPARSAARWLTIFRTI